MPTGRTLTGEPRLTRKKTLGHEYLCNFSESLGTLSMNRIVTFEIDFDALVDASDANRSTVENIYNLTKLHSDDDKFVSEIMSTTEDRYFAIESYLRSLFGDRGSRWDTKDLTSEYSLLRTSAPVDYDYGYVIEIDTCPGLGGKIDRMVAMPKTRVEYQSGRYSSGLFTSWECS